MDKKIVKAMYASVCAKEDMRPVLKAVHFEQDRCVATDTHILVVYKEGSEAFAGKNISVNGEEVTGNYPAYDRVFPKQELLSDYSPRVDLVPLQKACAWHVRRPDSHAEDLVEVRGKYFRIKFLSALLNLIALGGEIAQAEILQSDPERPSVIRSPKFDTLLMPVCGSPASIDAPRVAEAPATFSMENLVNTYAFENWKAPKVADSMAWLQ